MSVIPADIYDRFDGIIDTVLLSRAGQIGATWTRHPYGGWGGTTHSEEWRLDGSGGAYAPSYSYSSIAYLASGIPSAAEYDIRVPFVSLSDPGGDNHFGFSFLGNSSTPDFWLASYHGYYKEWRLGIVVNGTFEGLGTFADDQSAGPFPINRAIEVRVRNASPKVALYIDGIQRITSDDARRPGNRLGLYAMNGNPPTATSGLHLAQMSMGPIGYVLPMYSVSGPTSGPPGFVSVAYTVSLYAGENPGSITITPSASGIAGAFNPASVTLTNATRSGTFTFTPSSAGTATISFANNVGAVDMGPMSYQSAFLPPSRLSQWHAGWARFHSSGDLAYVAGNTNPDGTGGYLLDAYDHYDPIWCFQQIQEYSIRNGLSITDWSDQINAGLTRFRDRAVRAETGQNIGPDSETPGVIGYHRYLTGIMVDYFTTGDPKDVEAAGYLSDTSYSGNGATFIIGEEHDDKYRETAFSGITSIDYEMMGLGVHPLTDAACTTTLNYHDNFLLPETQRYGATYKPFMIGIGMVFLARYWERYRDSSVPAKVANVARIPNSIRNMCQKLWDHDWFPPDSNWAHGAMSYKSHSLVDPNNQKIEGLAVTSVINPRTTFRGPASLSAVDGFYNNCALKVILPGGSQIDDTWMIHSYTGATREIAVNPTYILQSDITTSHTFSIWPASWKPFDQDGDRGAEPSINMMTTFGYAWSYWYTKHIEGNASASQHWRNKFIEIFDGADQVWLPVATVKRNNQSTIYTFKALEYFYRGDSEWPVASTFNFQAPAPGAQGNAGVASGPFRVSIPYGQRTSGPEIIDPETNTGLGTFSAPDPILSDTLRMGMFTYTPDPADDGDIVQVTAFGSSMDPSGFVAYTVGTPDTSTPVTSYSLDGPTSGEVNVSAGYFLVALGTGTLAAPVRIVPAQAGGSGLFVPAYVDLSDSVRSGIFQFVPLSVGSRTISVSNNKGLANPPSIVYNALASTAPPPAPVDDSPKPSTMVPVTMVSSGGRPSWMIKT